MNILVTGAAGFIGANLVMRLLESGEPMRIVGLDSMNSYYDPSLKEYRLKRIEEIAAVPSTGSGTAGSRWTFVKGNLADRPLVESLF
ncbi:MAG: NAD-dependent epimerase/dehydratase family protein, partial [Bacteroidales bacterium]|nr:NAD-dependent epimerase/dehydratase family protein [Bacteroidales bacterium]